VEAAGVSVIALTVDNTTGRNSETYLRTARDDPTKCLYCHESGEGPSIKERPMYNGIDMTGVRTNNPAMDWPTSIDSAKTWKGKLIIKGWIRARTRECASNTASTR